ncbi:DUF952 domain-containing protein [Halomonas sp. LY9]
MRLFRVISRTTWDQTQRQGFVPRCGNDHKSDCIHLNLEEAVLYTANKYFTYAEAPLVLEIDAQAVSHCLEWLPPNEGQPWLQPRAYIDHLPQFAILSARPLAYQAGSWHWPS